MYKIKPGKRCELKLKLSHELSNKINTNLDCLVDLKWGGNTGDKSKLEAWLET